MGKNSAYKTKDNNETGEKGLTLYLNCEFKIIATHTRIGIK